MLEVAAGCQSKFIPGFAVAFILEFLFLGEPVDGLLANGATVDDPRGDFTHFNCGIWRLDICKWADRGGWADGQTMWLLYVLDERLVTADHQASHDMEH